MDAEPLKAEPVTGAGFDPAFIPGLTGPSPAGSVTKDRGSKGPGPRGSGTPDAKGSAAGEPVAGDPVADDPVSVATIAGAEADPSSSADPADDERTDDEQAAEGPVFEAADRRARIVADHRGVRLRLDEESCDFRWEEIAAVETETPRFGKRFTVTVHTPDRRWYPIEIEATARARFPEWESALDAVLDAYFEEA